MLSFKVMELETKPDIKITVTKQVLNVSPEDRRRYVSKYVIRHINL